MWGKRKSSALLHSNNKYVKGTVMIMAMLYLYINCCYRIAQLDFKHESYIGLYESAFDRNNLCLINTSEIEWEEPPERYFHNHPAIVAKFKVPECLRTEDQWGENWVTRSNIETEQDSKQNQKAVIGGNRKANCLSSQAGSTFSVAVGPMTLLLGCLDDLFLQSSAGTFLPGMGPGVLPGFGWVFKILSCYISSDSCMPKSKTMFSPYIKYFAIFSEDSLSNGPSRAFHCNQVHGPHTVFHQSKTGIRPGSLVSKAQGEW